MYEFLFYFGYVFDWNLVKFRKNNIKKNIELNNFSNLNWVNVYF